ncbi:MAG: hypothetical protein ABII90_13885 [Bacteroidota bacterium]
MLTIIKPQDLTSLSFYFFIPILLFLPVVSSLAQQQYLPLNRDAGMHLEKPLNHLDKQFHTSFKPYLQVWVNKSVNNDSLDNQRLDKKIKRSLLYRKLKEENLIIIDADDFYLTIDPLFNFEYGKDLADTSLWADTTHFYKNTRGIIFRGNIGKKVSFMSSFYENQAFFPAYIDDFTREYGVVPGQGRTKSFKTTGFDYAMASGYVSYSPSSGDIGMNFQLGHDKNFIGDGYRSLLLSDNSFNYPFFKITVNFWKIQFINLVTSLQNLNVRLPTTPTSEDRFQRKPGSFHFLSWNAHKRLQIGLFEGIIWQAADSLKNNGLFGVNLKFKISDNFSFYSQAVLDDVKSDKFGYQLGLKSFDLFTIKNLFFQIEFNQVQPYTYAHQTPPQSYTHYNQALAHPLGANFTELVSFADYSWRDFFVRLKFNYAIYEEDSGYYHWGKDIFRSGEEVITSTETPEKTNLAYQEFKLGYIINPKTNMNVVLGFINRTEKNSYWNKQTQFVYIGFRTSLANVYYDF